MYIIDAITTTMITVRVFKFCTMLPNPVQKDLMKKTTNEARPDRMGVTAEKLLATTDAALARIESTDPMNGARNVDRIVRIIYGPPATQTYLA